MNSSRFVHLCIVLAGFLYKRCVLIATAASRDTLCLEAFYFRCSPLSYALHIHEKFTHLTAQRFRLRTDLLRLLHAQVAPGKALPHGDHGDTTKQSAPDARQRA